MERGEFAFDSVKELAGRRQIENLDLASNAVKSGKNLTHQDAPANREPT
jgi:hypothetical protein